MKKFEINFGHGNIFPDESLNPILKHKIGEVEIEVEVDGGSWWITNVNVEGDNYNVYDNLDSSHYENISGNDMFNQLLEDGETFEDACKIAGGKWYVKIFNSAWAFIPYNNK